MRGLGPALAVSVAFAAWPVDALAVEQTFCVSDPACSGTPAATVADALAAAQANGSERDRIKVGSGTFPATSTLSDASDNPVLIEGDGESATVLTRSPSAGETILSLSNSQSGVSRLTVHIPAGQPEMIGIDLSAGAFGERLRITSPPGTSEAIGIQVDSGSTLRRSVVTLPNSTAAANIGIDAGANTVVESDGVNATFGILIAGSGALIRTVRVTGVRGVQLFGSTVADNTATVENTQVNSLAPSGPGHAAIMVTSANATHTVTLSARHLTLLGPGTGTGTGFLARGQANGPTPTATLNVLDSVVAGYETDLQGLAGPTGTASITIDSSAFDFAKQATNTNQATINPGPNNINLNGVDPKLRTFQGDRRPGFDSPLVDRGVPGGLLATESPLDLALFARIVDGNGDGTARRDIGAFEYQRRAPQVAASATPSTAGQGKAITFDASATDADPEEAPGITWQFDDGATATGASVQHAFASAGQHSATATAADPSGATAAAVTTVTILDTEAPRLRISSRAVTLTRKGVARVALTCPRQEFSGPCEGRLTLTTLRKLERPGGARARRIKLGSGRFSIRAGRTAKVRVRLSRANRRLVGALGRVRVRAAATVRDQAGNRRAARRALQLRRASARGR
jgi:PKD domain